MGGLGDAPIEQQYRDLMNALAQSLDEIFNGQLKGSARETGFVLLVFKFGTEGRPNYISNADRLDMVTLLREQLRRFEGMADPGTGTA